MDEEQNLYTTDLRLIGKAGDSEDCDDDLFWYDFQNF